MGQIRGCDLDAGSPSPRAVLLAQSLPRPRSVKCIRRQQPFRAWTQLLQRSRELRSASSPVCRVDLRSIQHDQALTLPLPPDGWRALPVCHVRIWPGPDRPSAFHLRSELATQARKELVFIGVRVPWRADLRTGAARRSLSSDSAATRSDHSSSSVARNLQRTSACPGSPGVARHRVLDAAPDRGSQKSLGALALIGSRRALITMWLVLATTSISNDLVDQQHRHVAGTQLLV